MSGIYGYYRRTDDTATDNLLSQLAQRSQHRVMRQPVNRHPVGVGAPNVSTEPYLISADLRLDNRQDLCRLLNLPCRPQTTDEQILIGAYRAWGINCLDHMLGDFAFALWDAAAEKLFCARDHFGVKPFIYLLRDNLFVFASEANVIGTIPSLGCTINEARIVDYRVDWLEGVDNQCTFFNEVLRLPPASLLTVVAQGHELRSYWQLDPGREIRFQSDSDYEDTFDELLNDAVRARTQSGSGGVMLSGGLDSALVTAVAGSQSDQPIKNYSGLLRAADNDNDSGFARALVGQINLDDRSLNVADIERYDSGLDEWLNQMADPFDMNMLQTCLLNLRAEEDGCTWMVDGIDGDAPHSLPSSYPLWIAREQGTLTALKEIYRIWVRWYDKEESLPRHVARYLNLMMTPDVVRQLKRLMIGSHSLRTFRQTIDEFGIDPVLARRVDLQARIEAEHALYANDAEVSVRQKRIAVMNHPGLVAALERYDRTAAVCGIEARHPLLDKRLVEFSLAIPWDQSGRDGWSKYLMRRVATRYLPPEVVWRTSSDDNGGEFILEWLASNDARVREVLKSSNTDMTDYGFSGRFVESDPGENWTLFCLLNWYRHVEKLYGGSPKLS